MEHHVGQDGRFCGDLADRCDSLPRSGLRCWAGDDSYTGCERDRRAGYFGTDGKSDANHRANGGGLADASLDGSPHVDLDASPHVDLDAYSHAYSHRRPNGETTCNFNSDSDTGPPCSHGDTRANARLYSNRLAGPETNVRTCGYSRLYTYADVDTVAYIRSYAHTHAITLALYQRQVLVLDPGAGRMG